MNQEISVEQKQARCHVLSSQCFDPKKYEYDFSFKPGNPDDPYSVHTTVEMLEALDRNKKIELESRVLCFNESSYGYKNLNRSIFKERFVEGEKKEFKFKEFDSFLTNGGGGGQGLVGQDFTPLLGGPFYKNLYFYQDYIRMHSECFFAYHNDPIAKAILSITRDFVIGTGFEVQCDTTTPQGKMALTVWKSFEEANDLHFQMDNLCMELGIYGETMVWWLPSNQTKIIYDLSKTDTIPIGIIPRVRLLDPSICVEIVTYPEDITRKLFYVFLFPTQYQIYTGGLNADSLSSLPLQPTLKFIYQQVSASEIMHYKVNAVSNEKRGRSDLFPVLSYLKRFRDSLNYSLIALQKVSAWAMDTTIKGNQQDIDDYVASQKAIGTIPEAGSEFVHSDSVSIEYKGNSSASGAISDAALYCLSAICAGTQIPFNYLGTHLSAGSTKASAVVATEPVAKKMEKRREVIKRILKDMWKRLQKEAGIMNAPDPEIIFPEIITQDKSQKLQDLSFGQQNGWFSKERVAQMAAKEMGMHDYDYNSEQERIDSSSGMSQGASSSASSPLSTPGKYPPLPTLSPIDQPLNTQKPSPASGLTGDERKDVKTNDSRL